MNSEVKNMNGTIKRVFRAYILIFSLSICHFPFSIFHFQFSIFVLSAGASYVSEIRFQESLKAFKSGDYRNAMLGFMDVVIEEPENAMARNYLSEAGRRVLGVEDTNTQIRRKELLHDAEAMKRRLVSLEESKKAKLREWDGFFSRAESLAGSADSLREAVAAYETFILKTPAYAELRGEFPRKDKIIRETFYRTIKNRYPEMVGGRSSVDEADLGGVFFAGEALNDRSYRYTDTRQTENILGKSSRIKYLRSGVAALLGDEARALELYSRGKFAEAAALFGKVMKAGAGNEEAAFYFGLAAERADAALPPPALRPLNTRTVRLRRTPAKLPGKVVTKPRPRQAIGGPGGRQPALAAPVTEAPQAAKAVASLPAVKHSSGAIVPSAAADGQPGGVEADKLYEQGVREFSVGDYAGAAKSWAECLRLDPGHTKARLGIGRLGNRKMEK